VATVSLEFDEAHERRFMRLNSLLPSNGVQSRINVREMVCGDVTHKRAHNFVVAHAAVQPAQEEHELHADGNEGGQNGGPVDGHVGALEVKEVNELEEVKDEKLPALKLD
jgi:hypothetical protein